MSKSRVSKIKNSSTVHMYVVVVNVKAFGNQSTLVLSYLIIILIALKTCEESRVSCAI